MSGDNEPTTMKCSDEILYSLYQTHPRGLPKLLVKLTKLNFFCIKTLLYYLIECGLQETERSWWSGAKKTLHYQVYLRLSVVQKNKTRVQPNVHNTPVKILDKKSIKSRENCKILNFWGKIKGHNSCKNNSITLRCKWNCSS
jgi:hypothetical protein